VSDATELVPILGQRTTNNVAVRIPVVEPGTWICGADPSPMASHENGAVLVDSCVLSAAHPDTYRAGTAKSQTRPWQNASIAVTSRRIDIFFEDKVLSVRDNLVDRPHMGLSCSTVRLRVMRISKIVLICNCRKCLPRRDLV
jgi:hypothetical protein